LHQCIRPLIGAFCVPGHHGYQRACDLTSGKASTGHSGHQCWHAPGRPNLHLVSSSRRPRRVKCVELRHRVLLIVLISCVSIRWPALRFDLLMHDDHAGWAVTASIFRTSKPPPRARTLQAMRASLLASAIASTLRCSRFIAGAKTESRCCRVVEFGAIFQRRRDY
jgi:hypothetical protein